VDPFAVILDQSVCDLDELSHDGDFGGFSWLTQVLIFDFEVRIEPHGNQCGHIEGIAQWFAPASDQRLALPLTGLACDGAAARTCEGLWQAVGHVCDLFTE